MASIFTFESEAPRVASPWPTTRIDLLESIVGHDRPLIAGLEMPPAELLTNCGFSKLEAEPQEGPTEYKLHLLLRPRRSFTSTSTVKHVSGSYLSKSRSPRSRSDTDVRSKSSPPLLAPSSQTRQNRLQHLTTQLLWRLQQSSPYHSTSKSALVLPKLPEADVKLSVSEGPGPLIPGLEESSGALYEIGVSDDGTFVGLTKDELEESLTVLRAMAFSLGCDVQIIRVMIVGDCEWTEESQTKQRVVSRQRQEKLWVAEVLVSPHLTSHKQANDLSASLLDGDPTVGGAVDEDGRHGVSGSGLKTEQLRVSLTGSTTSGKSSLLGTLSTSTLDNGRGKSRLSLLKHRHEIISGVTSSLAQELFGYENRGLSGETTPIDVINYASGNVSSWNDIHAASEQGRLVFITDSAGHPRYRRTTVRGLISWAPHWTLCCTAADDEEDGSGKIGATASSSEVLGSAGAAVDLSKAHLDLCLKLNLPLVIVITKLDIATKAGLRTMMNKVLSTLKFAGRRPVILPTSPNNQDAGQLQSITNDDMEAARNVINSVPLLDLHLLVPIVLTSAVTGSGIGRLHALLRLLPVSNGNIGNGLSMTHPDVVYPRSLFHVDEVFALPQDTRAASNENTAAVTILSGYLRYGPLEVGDKLLIGPCDVDVVARVPESPEMHHASSYPGLIKGIPKSSTKACNPQRPCSSDFTDIADGARESTAKAQTWQEVRITSLRNLRLPVQRLLGGQVGTVGIAFSIGPRTAASLSSISPMIRRGMVMIRAEKDPKAGLPSVYSRFSALFPEPSLPAWPGVLVVVYIASVRAVAKIVEVTALGSPSTNDEVFDFDDNVSDSSHNIILESPTNEQHTEVTFEFTTTREWIEVGTQVLVTPGGGPSLTGQPEQRDTGSAGLDGYVGTVTSAIV